MKIIRYESPRFEAQLEELNQRTATTPEVERTVRDIIDAVRKRRESAVRELNAKFGGLPYNSNRRPQPKLLVTPVEFQSARAATSEAAKSALRLAHANVQMFAKEGLRHDWTTRNGQGVQVGERFHPFERVGIYVPGGNAPLVSTAIMTVTLAAAAGVPEIVVATPSDSMGRIHPPLLFALELAGATEVHKLGGAQAIAALALGTKTIKAVTKIFGPGNSYVVEAKRQLFGTVAVDLLPGPSEILIIADHTADPTWIAADLLAQAEHGHGAVVLVTDSEPLLHKVRSAVTQQMATASRQEHVAHVVESSLYLVLARDLEEAVRITNNFAPEHLAIVTKEDEQLAPKIRTAGAIFLGRWSPVAGGDFVAGPSHELPTGGSGRSFSGLTVDQFQRRTSIIRFDKDSLRKSLPAIQTISHIEGLDQHGASAAVRLESDG